MLARLFLIASILVSGNVLMPTSAQGESLARLEEIAGKAKSLNEFLSRPKLIAQYHQALKQYQHRDKFRCESFDKILLKLKAISKVPGFSDQLWAKQDLNPILVKAFPSEDDALANHSVLTTYTFRPVPRLFHGIWNDPSSNGCLSDDCQKNDPTSPDRWAASLRGSQIYYVERDGIFTDQSIFITPLKANKRIYPLLTLGGGPGLTRSLTTVNSMNGSKQVTTLLEVWMARGMTRIPKTWDHFVMLKRTDQGLEVQNWRRATASHIQESKPIAALQDFSPMDDMAKGIETAMPRKCETAKGQTVADIFLGFVAPVDNVTKTVVTTNNTNIDPNPPAALLAAIEGAKLKDLSDAPSVSNPNQITRTETTETTITNPSPASTVTNLEKPSRSLSSLTVGESSLAQRSPSREKASTVPMVPSVSANSTTEKKNTDSDAKAKQNLMNGNFGAFPYNTGSTGNTSNSDPARPVYVNGGNGVGIPYVPAKPPPSAPSEPPTLGPNDNWGQVVNAISHTENEEEKLKMAKRIAASLHQAPEKTKPTMEVFNPNVDAETKAFQRMVAAELRNTKPQCDKKGNK